MSTSGAYEPKWTASIVWRSSIRMASTLGVDMIDPLERYFPELVASFEATSDRGLPTSP